VHEKQIESLARQITKLRQKSKSPRYPQQMWEQIVELRPYFTLAELSQRLGISAANLQRRVISSGKTPKKKIISNTPTLIPIPSGDNPAYNNSETPLFEMLLASGAKIRVFA
jgi:hypothetical protein